MRELTVTGLKARYKLTYESMKAVQDWFRIARKVDSNQPDGETYRAAQGVKGPSERKGENIAHTIPSQGFTIYNRDWDGGLVIPGKDWRWNKTSDTDLKVRQLAQLMAVHPGQLMETLLTAGDSTACADGQNFFATAHPVGGSTTQANLFTSASASKLDVTTATWPTSAEWADALLQVATLMMLFKDDQGNEINFGVTDFSVCVPSGLFPSLLKALAQQYLATGESNAAREVSKYRWNPVLLPRWTETDEFILISNGSSSLIYQELEDPADLNVLGPGTEYYIEKDEVRGIARGCYNCGFDRWQGAAQATFS